MLQVYGPRRSREIKVSLRYCYVVALEKVIRIEILVYSPKTLLETISNLTPHVTPTNTSLFEPHI